MCAVICQQPQPPSQPQPQGNRHLQQELQAPEPQHIQQQANGEADPVVGGIFFPKLIGGKTIGTYGLGGIGGLGGANLGLLKVGHIGAIPYAGIGGIYGSKLLAANPNANDEEDDAPNMVSVI